MLIASLYISPSLVPLKLNAISEFFLVAAILLSWRKKFLGKNLLKVSMMSLKICELPIHKRVGTTFLRFLIKLDFLISILCLYSDTSTSNCFCLEISNMLSSICYCLLNDFNFLMSCFVYSYEENFWSYLHVKPLSLATLKKSSSGQSLSRITC